MILTHGANSLDRGGGAAVQGWTKENVPAGVQITHDFGDGEGAVPAIPTDSCGVRNDIISVTRYDVHVDSCGVRNDIISVTRYDVHVDSCGVRNDIISIEFI
jgi:hypothetical protein